MLDLTPYNENTELRDNILNDAVGDADVFGNLDPETINSIVKAAGGMGFTQSGDIIGRDGKVLHKATDLRTQFKNHFSQSNELNPMDFANVVIDGVTHTINDKGEAVDATGNVIKTFDEVKALLKEGIVKDAVEEPTDLEGILNAVNTSLGIDFTDEQGNPITFEPTVEGLQARDKYLIDNVAAQMTREAVDSIFKADNDFESLYQYKRANGTSLGWTPTPDYSKTILLPSTDAKAEQQYHDIIVKAEQAQGRDLNTATMLAKYLIDDGKGEEMAKAALVTLNNVNKANAERQQAEAQAEEARLNNERVAYWNEIKSTIDKGVVEGVSIPAFISIKNADGTVRTVPRSSIYEYMSKPVKDGKSAMQLYASQMTPGQRVLSALMQITNYSYGDVAKATATTNKIEFIRKINNNPANKGVTNPNGKAAVDRVVL